MSQSLFNGLWLRRAAQRIDISYPGAIRDLKHAQAVAGAHGLEARAGEGGNWTVAIETERRYPEQVKAFFAQLNDLRPPPAPFRGGHAADPVVSCVVVVNENLPFVLEQFLPWLAASSPRHALEVILVGNGSSALEGLPEGVRAIRSEWGAVSKAYNAGAALARSAHLAFFHDDCLVCDPLWIEKCLRRLERGAGGVAGEYRQIDLIGGVAVPPLPVAKCVPLFVRKTDFEAAGGYDEQHYIGYEDLDFTLALAALGRKPVATDLEVVHFHGMSSTLKYNPVPGLADLYALAALPGFAIMRRFNEFWRVGLMSEGANYLRLAMDAQLLYVLQKYRALLAKIDAGAFARAEAALERQIALGCAQGPQAALSRLRALDRQAADEVRP